VPTPGQHQLALSAAEDKVGRTYRLPRRRVRVLNQDVVDEARLSPVPWPAEHKPRS